MFLQSRNCAVRRFQSRKMVSSSNKEDMDMVNQYHKRVVSQERTDTHTQHLVVL
jgi:hypothetical protein